MLKRLLFILLVPVYAFCQDYPAKPSNYVTDGAEVLGPDEEHRLNAVLKTFEDSSSIQLFIYTSSSLNGAVMADLTQKIFHEWKIGNKKTNNGVLIAVYVKDHKFRIHTGYGMEGILPDLRTKKIQDEIMRPYFKENNYFMGLVKGVDKIIFYSKHEYVSRDDEQGAPLWLIVPYSIQLFLFLIECIILFKFFRGSRKSQWSLFLYGLLTMLFPFFGIIGMIILVIGAYREGRYKTGSVYSSGNMGTGNTFDNYSSSSSYSFYDSSASDYSSSSSDSSFDGGGGGDSGGGGSDSDW